MSENIRKYVHPEGAITMRADKALAKFFAEEVSRTRLEESFKAGKVFFNGAPIEKKLMINAGDCIEVELPEPIKTEVVAVDIPVEIVYEDDDVVAVNKPAGMTVHPGSGTGDDTLVHAMMHHCKGKLSMAGGALRPGIVHRLDKDTSGIMIMAKTDAAYFKLVELFSEREVHKEYIAIIAGVPTVRSGTIKKSISRHPVFKTKMCVCDEEMGRDAHTDWRILQSYGDKAALISCQIHTGRTHQIRVHMSEIGFPIMGDYTYRFQKNKFKDIPPPARVMLHSYKLSLPHPINEEEYLELEASPPTDFTDLQALLKSTYDFKDS